MARSAQKSGRAAVAELHARQRMWRGALARDHQGFDRGDVDASPADADRVITVAKQLVGFVSESAGDMPYASMLVNDLTALIERAEAAWSTGQAELSELQVQQGELRARGRRFLKSLVRLRVVLREVLGRHHRDYRALRASPRGGDDEVVEVEADDDATAATVQPAVAGTAPSASADRDTA